MVNRTYFTFPSRDGFHTIHAMKWQSDEVEPVGILQLIHGMAEYVARYEEVAVHFAEKGFIVVGDDHLGHGDTAKEYGDYGFFCKNDPVTEAGSTGRSYAALPITEGFRCLSGSC